MTEKTLQDTTVEIANRLQIGDEFEGWDGEFLGIYLPEVDGGPSIGEIVRRQAERRAQTDFYIVDIGQRSFGISHSAAKSFIAELDKAAVPYEHRSKREADNAWAEFEIEAMTHGATLSCERIVGGFRVTARPNLPSVTPRPLAVDSLDAHLTSAKGESVEKASEEVLTLLKRRQQQ